MNHLLNICNINGAEVDEQYKDPPHGTAEQTSAVATIKTEVTHDLQQMQQHEAYNSNKQNAYRAYLP